MALRVVAISRAEAVEDFVRGCDQLERDGGVAGSAFDQADGAAGFSETST